MRPSWSDSGRCRQTVAKRRSPDLRKSTVSGFVFINQDCAPFSTRNLGCKAIPTTYQPLAAETCRYLALLRSAFRAVFANQAFGRRTAVPSVTAAIGAAVAVTVRRVIVVVTGT